MCRNTAFAPLRAARFPATEADLTHANEASLALGVTKHLLHGAVQQGVGTLGHKRASTGGQQRAAALGLQQQVREEEEHLWLGAGAFERDQI